MKRWQLALFAFLAIALVVAVGYWGYSSSAASQTTEVQVPPTVAVERGDVSLSVTAPGELVNYSTSDLYITSDGVVGEILVREGDTVLAGEPLVKLLYPEELEADLSVQIADAQQRLANAQSDLEKANAKRIAMNYPNSTDPLIIEQAWVRYQLARIAYRDALNYFQKFENKPLLNQNRIVALDALIVAQQAMDEALSLYNWYTGHATDTQKAQADAEIAVAQAAMELAQAELDRLLEQQAGQVISAPTDGVVLKVLVETGQAVSEGTAVITFTDPSAVEAQTTVIEEDYPLVLEGQTAEFFFDALPELSLTGEVARIVPQRVEGADRPLYYVYIALEEVPEKLVEGMTVDASVVIDSREGVLRLPRSVVHAGSENRATVTLWVDGQEVERQVELGLRGDLYVEIVSGLEEGELVVAN